MIHTAFNVAAVVFMYPFTWALERLAYLTIPERGGEMQIQETTKKEIQILDSPGIDNIFYCPGKNKQFFPRLFGKQQLKKQRLRR